MPANRYLAFPLPTPGHSDLPGLLLLSIPFTTLLCSVGEFAAALTGFFLIGECILQPPMLAMGLSDNIDR